MNEYFNVNVSSIDSCFVRPGQGYGLTFTPEDLQEMSTRALDILKRFVDENTMLRKEVVRLQDDRTTTSSPITH